MSTKGKRMANNSDNKKNINSEELYDNANSENYKYGVISLSLIIALSLACEICPSAIAW